MDQHVARERGCEERDRVAVLEDFRNHSVRLSRRWFPCPGGTGSLGAARWAGRDGGAK